MVPAVEKAVPNQVTLILDVLFVVCPDDILGFRMCQQLGSTDTSSALGHPSKTSPTVTMRRAFLQACWHSSPWLAAQAVSTVPSVEHYWRGWNKCLLSRKGWPNLTGDILGLGLVFQSTQNFLKTSKLWFVSRTAALLRAKTWPKKISRCCCD